MDVPEAASRRSLHVVFEREVEGVRRPPVHDALDETGLEHRQHLMRPVADVREIEDRMSRAEGVGDSMGIRLRVGDVLAEGERVDEEEESLRSVGTGSLPEGPETVLVDRVVDAARRLDRSIRARCVAEVVVRPHEQKVQELPALGLALCRIDAPEGGLEREENCDDRRDVPSEGAKPRVRNRDPERCEDREAEDTDDGSGGPRRTDEDDSRNGPRDDAPQRGPLRPRDEDFAAGSSKGRGGVVDWMLWVHRLEWTPSRVASVRDRRRDVLAVGGRPSSRQSSTSTVEMRSVRAGPRRRTPCISTSAPAGAAVSFAIVASSPTILKAEAR